MPDSPLTGLTASVKIGAGVGAKVIGYISGVDLTLEKEIIEILSFGAEYKEKVPAIKNWSASIDGTYAANTGSAQQELYEAFEDDTMITLGIYLTATHYFEGTGLVSKVQIKASPNDKISISAEVAGSGAISQTLGA